MLDLVTHYFIQQGHLLRDCLKQFDRSQTSIESPTQPKLCRRRVAYFLGWTRRVARNVQTGMGMSVRK